MCLQLTCPKPVEAQYYSSVNDLGVRKDICCYCCAENTEIDQNVKKTFKTVLPVCANCLGSGKESVCQRPFGKESK